MPPVILVSGWGFTPRVMEPLAAALPPGPRVFASATSLIRSARARQCSPAEELVELLNMQDGPSVLIGWSLGAILSLQALPLAADRIRHLHLLSPTLRFLQADDYPCGTPAPELRALMAGIRRNPSATLAAFARTVADPNSEWLPDPLPSDWLESDPAALIAGLEILRDTDLRALPLPAVPCTVVHGDADRIIPAEAGRRVARAIPGAAFHLVHGLGHLAPLHDPVWQAGLIASL